MTGGERHIELHKQALNRDIQVDHLPPVSHEPDPLPHASVLLAALIDAGVSHVIGLPDNGSAALFDLL